MHRFIPGLLSLLLLSCGTDLEATEVVLIVDSDLQPIVEINRIDVSVFDASGQAMGATASLMAGDIALPRTIGIVNEGERLGPFRIEATAFLDGMSVLSRTMTFDFVADRIMQLRLDLTRACLDVECVAPQSCNGRGVCAGTDVELEDFTGEF
ncbi:MAG: hypothetical protein AAF411_29010 [Myxococcota bacterium]